MAEESAVAVAAPETAAAPSASPAVSSAPAAASASPASAATTAPEEHETTTSFITRTMDAKKAEADRAALAAPAVAAPEKKAEEAAAPVKAEAEKPAEAPAVLEEKKPEEEGKKPEVAEAAQPAEDDEEFELQPIGPLPPKDLAQKLKENPELGAALEKAGIKDQIFAASRLAQRVAEYEETFPDVESAKYAAQAATDFGQLSDKFTSVKDMASARDFMAALLPFSYTLDEEGQPIKDAAGRFIDDGSVGRFLDNTLGLVLDYQAERAKKDGDEDFLAAIEMLKARTGRSPASAVQEHMTEEQKKTQAEQDAREAKIRTDETTRLETKHQEFELSVTKEIDSELGKRIDKLLEKADLSDFNRKYLREEIMTGVIEKVKARKDFFMQLDNLMKRPMSEKTRKERVTLALRTIKPILPTVARDKFAEAGVRLKSQAAEKEQKQAIREEASRSEQRAGVRPAAPIKPQSDEEIAQKVTKEYVAKHGREPNTSELFQLVIDSKRKGA